MRLPTLTLGELTATTRPIQYGVLKPGPNTSGGVPLVRVKDISTNTLVASHLYAISHELDREFQRTRLRGGELLVSVQGTVGKVAIVPDSLAGANVSRTIAVVDVNEQAVPAYVRYWLLYLESTDSYPTVGSTRASLNIADLRKIRVPIPALVDQLRLARLLDAEQGALAALTLACAARAKQISDMRVAVLRESVPLRRPSPWPWVRLDRAAEFLDHKRRPVSWVERVSRLKGTPDLDRVPYYGANGQAGWINDYLFDEPLVLLAEDGGAFGSPCSPIAYRINGKAWVNNHAHVLRAQVDFDVDYLGFALSIRPDVGELVSGSTRGKLNQSVASAIEVPMPPLPEQRRIASLLRSRLAVIDGIDESAQAAEQAIELLHAGILRRAFEDLAA